MPNQEALKLLPPVQCFEILVSMRLQERTPERQTSTFYVASDENAAISDGVRWAKNIPLKNWDAKEITCIKINRFVIHPVDKNGDLRLPRRSYVFEWKIDWPVNLDTHVSDVIEHNIARNVLEQGIVKVVDPDINNGLFKATCDGLQEYYPCLKHQSFRSTIFAKIDPSYEHLRDQIEAFAKEEEL